VFSLIIGASMVFLNKSLNIQAVKYVIEDSVKLMKSNISFKIIF